MTPLGEKLLSRIRAYGPMTVAEFMEACLSDPHYGYYMRREPFGRYGDFVTAPEVSQIFGELIGIWAIVVWQAMGSPREFVLAELGPGRGTLMADVLRIGQIMPEFTAAARVHLIETSPRLVGIQEKTLAGYGTAIHWHSRIEALPPGPMIAIANEFFDALPIRQFRWSSDGWSERVICVGDDGKLAFGLQPVEQRPLAAPLPDGAIIETSPIGTAIMETISGRIAATGGALLAIDYGTERPGHGDTLQAVREHKYADPLAAPGEVDLTAHVDFATLASTATAAGARPRPLLSQGDFLNRLGLASRVETLAEGKDAETQQTLEASAERLAGPKTMGDLFKVLAVSAPDLLLPAFDQDG